MDNNEMDINSLGEAKAAGYAVTSIMCSIFSWIDFQIVDNGFSLLTKVISVGVGIMAIRHYYLQDKNKSK